MMQKNTNFRSKLGRKAALIVKIREISEIKGNNSQKVIQLRIKLSNI